MANELITVKKGNKGGETKTDEHMTHINNITNPHDRGCVPTQNTRGKTEEHMADEVI